MGTSSNGYALVLIPAEDDYVWKLSSEKVPHLTLLFLGNQLDNVERVSQYVQHVANTSMRRVGLSVERRGSLGPKDADVLFFRNGGPNVKLLEQVRSYFLKNPDISTAYNSTEQFPSWTPHLTMGYPESPAKKDTRDYPGIHWVDFDRVALWTDNYDGPEFVLKDDYYDLAEVPMSGIDSTLEDVLAHYGIKGMRWGVRRTQAQIHPGSTDHRRAEAIRAKAKTHGVKSLTNKQLKDASSRLSAEQKYHELNQKSSTFTKGHNAVKGVLAVGGTIGAAYALATSPAAKAGAAWLGKFAKPAAKAAINAIR